MSDKTPATVDFDHHSPEFFENRHEKWADVRKCPIAHNSQYGGFWVASGYEEVAAVARDSATFTSKYVADDPDGFEYIGIMGVPRIPGIPPALIAEVEGPTHVALRRMLNPFMLPSAVESYRPFIEACATWFMDQVIESGSMEVIRDFTGPVPAVLTMRMVGLPCESWASYAEVFHSVNAYKPGTPEFDRSRTMMSDMITELLRVAEERRHDPKDDIISRLVEMRVDDNRPFSDAEIIGVLWNLIGGGIDTTTSLTALTMSHLDEHHDVRDRLINEPDLLAPATEEYLRYTSVNETLTRTVTKDVELSGQTMHRGDFLMMSWLAANFDESVFENPNDVIVDRSPNPHLAFGVGPHRCIGMHIARALFGVMMREILSRIPDFIVDREATKFYRGNPELAGVVVMPLSFTPGTARGIPRPF